MRELAKGFGVPVEYLENENYRYRISGIQNAFKGGVYILHPDFQNLTRKEEYDKLTTVAQWIVDTYPIAIEDWRQSLLETFDEWGQRAKLPKTSPYYLKLPKLSDASRYEKPFYMSDPDFYKKAKKHLFFVWQNFEEKIDVPPHLLREFNYMANYFKDEYR